MNLIDYYKKLKNIMFHMELTDKQQEVIDLDYGYTVFARRQGCTTAAAYKALDECVNCDNNIIFIVDNVINVNYIKEMLKDELDKNKLEYKINNASAYTTISVNDKKINIYSFRHFSSDFCKAVKADVIIADMNHYKTGYYDQMKKYSDRVVICTNSFTGVL